MNSDPVLLPYEGYWIRVFQKNVFLRFPVSAQTGDTAGSGKMNDFTMEKKVNGSNGFAKTLAESPPPPVGRSSGSANTESGEEHAAACFVSSLLSH